jgi:hypothetical protein
MYGVKRAPTKQKDIAFVATHSKIAVKVIRVMRMAIANPVRSRIGTHRNRQLRNFLAQEMPIASHMFASKDLASLVKSHLLYRKHQTLPN